MKIMNVLSTVAVCCFIGFLVGARPAPGQTNEVRPEERTITIEMTNQPLGSVFGYLMETYDVQIGFEQSNLDIENYDYRFQTNLPFKGRSYIELDEGVTLDIEVEEEFVAKNHFFTVKVQNGPLKAAMNQIVRQMENYRWEVNEGVINFVPSCGRDEILEELLETRIEKFRLPSGGTVDDITKVIKGLGEFSMWMKRNNLYFNPTRTGSSILLEAQYRRKLESSLNFCDLSFRELLNRITKSKKGGWILKRRVKTRDGKEQIYLDI